MENYSVVMRTQVDDYEHSGDLDNAMESWKKVGFKIGNVNYDKCDGDSPIYDVTAIVNDTTIQKALGVIRDQIDYMSNQRLKDYSCLLCPEELLGLLETCDNQYKTKFEEKYKSIIWAMQLYYGEDKERPESLIPIPKQISYKTSTESSEIIVDGKIFINVEDLIKPGKRGITNAIMIPAIHKAIEEASIEKLEVLKLNHEKVYTSSMKHLGKKHWDLYIALVGKEVK